MKTPSDSQNSARLKLYLQAVTQKIAIIVALIGVVVILGWVFDISVLKGILPGLPTMKVNTALCILLGGISLGLGQIKLPLRSNRLKRTLRHVSVICAALIILITVLMLLQYGFQINLGIDELLMRQPEPVGSQAVPGRMAPNTAFTLLFIGSALLLKTRLSQSLVMQGFAIAAWLLAFVALLGHIYGTIYFFTAGFSTGMALHTAMACLLLSTGILSAHPERGIMSLFFGEGTGSILARRLLPLAMILPPFIWGVCEAGERWHLYRENVEVALASTLNSILFAGLVSWNAAQLNTADQRRRRAELALQQTNLNLEQQRAELLQASDRLQMELFERERTERALQLSQARFAGILEIANDAIISVNPQQVITLFNQGAEKIFGYKAEEVLGQPLDLLLPSRQHIEHFNQADGQARRTGERQEIFGRRKNGTEFAAEASISKLEVGNEIVFTAFLRDISEQKAALRDRQQALIALQHYVNEVSDLYNQAPCGYHSLDENGVLIKVNDTELTWLGYTREELIGKNMLDLLTPNSCEVFREIFSQFKQQGWLKGLELEMIRSDGTILPVLLNATAIKDAGGKYVKSRSTIYDISDLKQIELEREQAQKALQRYERIVSATIDAIFLVDVNYIYRIVNESYLTLHQKKEENFIGYSVAEILGQEVFETIIKPRLDQCLEGQTIEFEMCYNYPNIGRQFISVTYTPYRELDQKISGIVVIIRNITKLKQAEQALHESEERLQLAMEASGDGLWDWNIADDEVYYNPRYLEMLGYAADELPHNVDTWGKLVHPDDMVWVKDIQAAHLQHGSVSYSFDYRLRTKSGEWKWVADYGRVVKRDADGKPLRMIGTHRDINDRKALEQDLLHQRELLNSFIQSAHVGMCAMDAQLRYTLINEVLAEINGIPIEDHFGKTPWDIVPDLASKQEKVFRQVLETGQPVPHFEVTGETKKLPGVIRTWLASYFPIRDSLNHPTGIGIAVVEITERKRAEEALRQSEEKFRSAFEDAAIGMALVATDGRWLKVNPALCELTGYSESELLALSFQDITHPEDLEADLNCVQQILSGEIRTYQREKRYFHKQGHIVWIIVNGSLVRDQQGQPLYYISQIEDISDRKQIEEELRQSQHFLQKVADAIPHILYLFDLTQIKTSYLNQQSIKVLGYSPEEICQADPEWFVNCFHPDDRHLCYEVSSRFLHLSDYEILSTEYRFRHKNGEWLWLYTREVVFARDADGVPIQILGAVEDISDRKQAEAQLRQSEAKLAMAQRIAHLGSWELFLNPMQRVWSEETFRIFGLEPSSTVLDQKAFLQMLHPDDRLKLEHLIQQAIAQGQPFISEYRIIRPDGSIRYLETRAEVAVDAQGQITKLFGSILDITERKQIEQALRYSETTKRALIQAIPDTLIRMRKDGTHLEIINHERIHFLGNQDAQQNPNVADILPPDVVKERLHCATQALETGMLQSQEYQLIIDGQYFYEEARIVPLQNDEVLLMVRDITDRKQMELDLQHAKGAAEAANKAKSIFLANMSHELRTPLNVILGFTQVMSRDPAFTPEQRENVQIIHRSGEHLLSLINDILDLSKIEAGRTELEESSFDLIASLKSVQEMFRQRAQTKGLRFNLDLSSNLPQYITADFTKLRQILINLLSNAIKFTEKGGVTLRVKAIPTDSSANAVDKSDHSNHPLPITHHPSPITHYPLHFEVEDTGIGIATNELNAIFAPFTQAQVGRRSQDGTGLGLTISRQFVRLMQGELQVRSIPSQGSLFHFAILVKIAQASDVSQIQKPRRVIGLAPGQPQYRILVVDDQPENRQLLVKLLQPIGLEVREAANGEEAIALWEQWQPHLIWMDMRMPGIDGYEATRQIRVRESGRAGERGNFLIQNSKLKTQNSKFSQSPVPIIALTAQASKSDRTLALAAGCNDFISKPFEETVLFTKMAEHLGVRYLYADDDQQFSITPHHPSDSSQDLTAASLLVMPSQWIELLHQAALLCDDDAIEQLIQQIPAEQVSLIAGLKHLNRNYQFKAIAQLIL